MARDVQEEDIYNKTSKVESVMSYISLLFVSQVNLNSFVVNCCNDKDHTPKVVLIFSLKCHCQYHDIIIYHD